MTDFDKSALQKVRNSANCKFKEEVNMRHFHSYGPIDCEDHFCVQRHELIKRCMQQLIGNPQKSGHYFTIWGPRQTGKTWLMRQAEKKINLLHQKQFDSHTFSLGVLRGEDFDPVIHKGRRCLPWAFRDLIKDKLPGNPEIATWQNFSKLFSKNEGLWKCPLILFIDEADTAPAAFLDLLAGQFRELYLDRKNNFLHGLALIGVRAVLGAESERGSPFNIQRSLHVPNFIQDEVNDLFKQYQDESGQKIAPEVVNRVYDVTRGQPGLVCWFGELLTEKYNPGENRMIQLSDWREVHRCALNIEWNNTVLNLVKKAKARYYRHVLELFTQANLKFSIDADWCNYLYLNGIIDSETKIEQSGIKSDVSRFASPFIQLRLYNALTYDLIGDLTPVLSLDPLDELEDVFEGAELNVTALLGRYKNYLSRLKAQGINPWKDQPRRQDLHYTEAVGHFHLYHWLQNAVERFCVISPEFPTGNGKVDLHLKCGDMSGLIEVKSFTGALQLKEGRKQAADYAKQCGLKTVAVALFAPLDDDAVLSKLSTETVIDNVAVAVTAIGWV